MAGKMPTKRAKKAALDKALHGMFKRLQARPLPDHLASVVEQLEAADAAPRKKKTGS